jgi:hypothetical protein
MVPQPKPKSIGAGLRARQTRNRSTTGAGVTGAGCGALLLHVLKAYQDRLWAQTLLYLAPSISLIVSAGVLWFRAQLREYTQRKLQTQKYKDLFRHFEEAEKIIEDVLNNPKATPSNKAKAEKALSELNDLRTETGLEIAKQTT